MLIIPAIDIMGGRCVRLRRGNISETTVFSPDPAAIARLWERLGATWIHVVDLDGAFEGRPVNLDAVRRVCASVGVPVQVGGGLRDLESVQQVLETGACRVILGTAALLDPKFLAAACRRYRGRVVGSIDLKAGRVAVRGWTETIQEDVESAFRRYTEAGVDRIVVTDVSRDGMLSGVNTSFVEPLLDRDARVIVSGGVTSKRDLDGLRALESRGLEGVIIGRALYTGVLRLDRLIEEYQTRTRAVPGEPGQPASAPMEGCECLRKG